MLIAFLLIILIGLAGFTFVFTKALKSRAVPPPLTNESLLSAPAIPEDETRLAVELKIVKLEQMLDEKNKVVAALQKSLQSSDVHEAEINGLKQIFQSQIEELKQQNKYLKSEADRLSQENLDLQTKVYAGQPPKLLESEHIVVDQAASVNSSDKDFKPVIENNRPQLESAQMSSLSLHDVFSEVVEKNS